MKRFILGLTLLSGFAFGQSQIPTKVQKILSAKTATGAGSVFMPLGPKRSFQALGTTASGSGAAVVALLVSDDCVNYISAGTVTLTLGVAATTDGFVTDSHWKCIKANVNSISGTGASVDAWIGN